jgi:flagellar biosynthesis protein FlhB
VLGPKFERLNPLTNWKRVFNMQAIVRTGFAVLKLVVLVTVLWLVVGDRLPTLLRLHEQPIASAGGVVADLALTILLWVSAVVTALAAADWAWQRWSFEQRNMMTKQEIDDERKRSEGDPAIKNRQRRARNELLKQRMVTAVPKADVVITNPTHFAVALRGRAGAADPHPRQAARRAADGGSTAGPRALPRRQGRPDHPREVLPGRGHRARPRLPAEATHRVIEPRT